MGWGGEGGEISLSSNGKIDMNARKIYIVPLYIVKDCISLTDIIMRLFERCIYKNEIADVIYYSIDSDQYAYKVGHNSTMALIKCQHTWLKGLDNGAKYVRVYYHLTLARLLTVFHTTYYLKKLRNCLLTRIS